MVIRRANTRAGRTQGQARAAVRPSATRPAATALAPRRGRAAIAIELTCACLPSVPVRASPGIYARDDHGRRGTISTLARRQGR